MAVAVNNDLFQILKGSEHKQKRVQGLVTQVIKYNEHFSCFSTNSVLIMRFLI